MASRKRKKRKDPVKAALKAELRAKYAARADQDRAERLAGFKVQLEKERAEREYRDSHEDISFQQIDIAEKAVPMRVVLIRDPRSRRFR